MKSPIKNLETFAAKNERFKVGNDVIYLPDFYEMLTDLFVDKVFTDNEKNYARQFHTPQLRFASTFSAKESIYKAIKQWHPKEKIGFKKIEIRRKKPGGTPYATVHHPLFQKLNISLSISHDGNYVWTVAIVNIL